MPSLKPGEKIPVPPKAAIERLMPLLVKLAIRSIQMERQAAKEVTAK